MRTGETIVDFGGCLPALPFSPVNSSIKSEQTAAFFKKIVMESSNRLGVGRTLEEEIKIEHLVAK